MFAFSEAKNILFEKLKKDPDADVSLEIRKCWSFAFGMYVLLRSALEALSILRKIINDSRVIETYYEENIKRMIDIANDIVKHPMFKNSPGSFSSYANSIDIGGEIDVIKLRDDGTFDVVNINPFSDFELVRGYIENTAEELTQTQTEIESNL